VNGAAPRSLVVRHWAVGVYRTGLSKVGIPGAALGLRAEDPTIAELLKPLGYATGQFGKNHLGDRNEYLPTVHGFDEFFGSLYHLNAEEEPERPNYPPHEDFPHFRDNWGPRGVLRCWATDEDDASEHPRWGRVGCQRRWGRAAKNEVSGRSVRHE
jgi:arylsulfatase